MLDDIGLGSAIANLIYLIIILVGILGLWFFLRKKMISGAIFWTSAVLNFFAYLYFMGNYVFYNKIVYVVVNKYWPWINIILLILLIIRYVKRRNAKAK